jgi:hypothetical protein
MFSLHPCSRCYPLPSAGKDVVLRQNGNEWRNAELPDRLQNGTTKGRGGAAEQSIRGRMGLERVCKDETSRMKTVSIESSGGRKLYLRVEENTVFTDKFLYIHVYIYIKLSSVASVSERTMPTE